MIIAISQYAPSTGWRKVNAENDIVLIRSMLLVQGFKSPDIHVLRDKDATRGGILKAIRGTLLEPAGPGDIVVLHYSGHGQQITDQGTDEMDGYDEAIVPYDAPSSLEGGYGGARHLRDDKVDELVQQLRIKVGPEGHVVVFLDTCFSGTPRGGPTRGGPPLGPPRRERPGPSSGLGSQSEKQERDGGFFEPVSRRGTAWRSLTAQRAPYIVFSAARHDQFAWETTNSEGDLVGSLSYSLTREMADLRPGTTYRTLYERVRWLMARRVRNEPQVEGNDDTLIFNGDFVGQRPYFGVESVGPSRDTVKLAGGSLLGVLENCTFEIHEDVARQPTGETRIAVGKVVHSSHFESTVELDQAIDPAGSYRAFEKKCSYGSARVRIRLSLHAQDLERRLRSLLETKSDIVEITSSKPDVIISSQKNAGRSGAEISIETVREGEQLMSPVPISASNLDRLLTDRLRDFARNRYLRGLKMTSPAFQVRLELIPVGLTNCLDGEVALDTCTVTILDPSTKPTVDGFWTWEVGDYFRLRVSNEGQHPAHLNVLDLAPDGAIDLLWPPPQTGDKTQLAAGGSRVLDALYQVTTPIGDEVLFLVATQRWIDFRPILSHRSGAAGGRGREDDILRSRIVPQGGGVKVSIDTVPIRVVRQHHRDSSH